MTAAAAAAGAGFGSGLGNEWVKVAGAELGAAHRAAGREVHARRARGHRGGARGGGRFSDLGANGLGGRVAEWKNRTKEESNKGRTETKETNKGTEKRRNEETKKRMKLRIETKTNG